MKKNSKGYNHRIKSIFEEKKENMLHKNKNSIINLQINGIINDLKVKGFNSFINKDKYSITKKNNNLTNTIQNSKKNSFLKTKIQKMKKVEYNNKGNINPFKNELDINKNNKNNKFNFKKLILNKNNEIRNKLLNGDIRKKNYSKKINYVISKPILKRIKTEVVSPNKSNKKIGKVKNNSFQKKIDKTLKKTKVDSINSFNVSEEKKIYIKENKNIMNNIRRNIRLKSGRVTKYKNKKTKNINTHNKNNNNIEKENSMYISFIKQISERFSQENIKNYININKEKKKSKSFNKINDIYGDYIINSKNLIYREISSKQIRPKFNLSINNVQNINNNSQIDKIIEYISLSTAINNNNNIYNNFSFHDISKNEGYSNSFYNSFIKGKNFRNNDIGNTYIRTFNKIEDNKIKINETHEKNIENFKEINNFKLKENIRKSKYNNYSQRVIYDYTKNNKNNNIIHNNIVSINIEYNPISSFINSFKNNKDYNIIKNTKIQNTRKDIINLTVSSMNNKKEFNSFSNIKQYEDGLYEGIIINGKREKNGIMKYNKGEKYDGEWKNDKRHGKGVFISQNYNTPGLTGIKYVGEFNHDKIEGFGIGYYSSGDRYEGEWKNNKQYGRGILNYVGGGKYIGEWENGKLNGEGIYFLKNGERFEGKFIDNKYNGYGKYYYINGDYLEGIFKDDLPNGDCILHKPDGTTENRHYN